MKMLSQNHTPVTDKDNSVSDISLTEAAKLVPLIQVFEKEGWALPVRSTFRYTYKQKKLLYDFFMEGEISGKKMRADQVEKLSRKKLEVEEYVTAKQIKSLFSRWSQQYRKGKLKEPNKKEFSSEAVPEDEFFADDDEDFNVYLQNQAKDIINTISWNKDDWIAVSYESEWYPGVIVDVSNNVM